jgi:Methyltransferase domain
MLAVPVSGSADYRQQVERIRAAAAAALPRHAVVMVISHGDPALLDLGDGRTGWHFPRTAAGEYVGSHPADDIDAVAHLTACRALGATHLVIPAPSLWWLEHYNAFRSHLQAHARLLLDNADCRIYQMTGAPSASPADEVPLDRAAAALLGHAFDPAAVPRVADAVARVVQAMLTTQGRHAFEAFQARGLHVLPVHYYSPVPDTRALLAASDQVWGDRPDPPGIDWNEAAQLRLLRKVFPTFRQEYEAIPREKPASGDAFYLGNGMFDGVDALVLYCMIRHLRPRRVLEVGSGFSSLLTAAAMARNGDGGELVCIEPFPSSVLTRGFPGLTHLIVQPVQQVPLDQFERMGAGDVLFIDSTHVVKTGSDVNFLFFEVIPRLRSGVVVHVHDVFLPGEFPRNWVTEELRFWNEQYLLRAFLLFNGEFEVLLSNAFLDRRHPQALRETFPKSPWWLGGSFWMRRK